MSVWRWPIAIALLSSSGLAVGLFFDGWGDAYSWAGLGVPVALSVWCWKLRRTPVAASGRPESMP